MKDVRILQDSDSRDLEERIQDGYNNGFKLLGPVQVVVIGPSTMTYDTEVMFLATMVKEEE